MFLAEFLDKFPLEWLFNGVLALAVLLNGLLVEIGFRPAIKFNESVLIWIDRYSEAMVLVSLGIFIAVIGPWVEGMARVYGSADGISAAVEMVLGGNRLHLLQFATYLFFFGLISLSLLTVRKIRAKNSNKENINLSKDASWYFSAIIFALPAISFLQFALEHLSKTAS